MAYFDGMGNELNIGIDIDDSDIRQAVSDYLDDNPSVLTVFDTKLIGKKIINGNYNSIICLGDSITNGNGGTDGYCYATVLSKYINERYGITVSKMGYPGSVASYQYDRIMGQPAANRLVIWLTGTNNRALHWQDYQTQMPTYIESVKAISTDVLIMSCPPSPDDATATVKTADIDDYLKKTFYGRQFFIDLNQEYIKYFGSSIASSYYDTIHPNDTGYLGIFTILCHELGLPLDYQTDYSQSGAWWNG